MTISPIKLAILILTGLNYGCFNDEDSAIMEFKIEVPKTEVIVQESIPIKFQLTNIGEPVGIPFEYNSSDVVTLLLFDDQEKLVTRSDGYTKRMRLKPRPPVKKTPQGDMETGELGRGQTMEWEEDLLSYMDIRPPGKYFVQARFRFQPADIWLDTQKIPLNVKENNSDWMDVLCAQISMAMSYYIQRYEAEVLFQISNGFELMNFWKGGTLRLTESSRPRVSEADFATQKTFDHDFFRWLVWIDRASSYSGRSRLRATSFTESKPLDRIYEYPLGQENFELVGRPIQHIDRGVSVIVLGQESGRYNLTQLDFDSSFSNRNLKVLSSFDFRPRPLSAASDWQGQIYVVAGRNGGLPLRLIRVSDGEVVEQKDVLSDSHFPGLAGPEDSRKRMRIMSVFPDVSIRSASVKAVLAVALLENESGIALKLIRIPLDSDKQESESVQTFDASINVDSVVAADITQGQDAVLHAIVITGEGEVFYIQQGAEPQPVVDINADLPRLLKLIVSAQGDVHVFFLVKGGGIGYRVLYRSFRL